MKRDCKVCLITHDPEIHEATLRVHQWFREQIALMTDSLEEWIEAPAAAEP